MPTITPTPTKIKKVNRYDSMSLSAKFHSGASLKFLVNRSGERLEVAFSNDPEMAKEQTRTLAKWLEPRDKEVNSDIFERLEKLCKECTSGKDLISKITQ
jgi:hypothetical protein